MSRLIVLAAAAACSPATRSPVAADSVAVVDTGGDAASVSDPCSPEALGTSYIGCEYYPVVTANMVDEVFDFAVVVANSSAVDATVTFDGGPLSAPITTTAPAGGVIVQKLPWQQALKLCDTNPSDCQGHFQPTSAYAIGDSFRIRSTQPVTVYQFNPLEYTLDGSQYSYTNDASLLLPTNA